MLSRLTLAFAFFVSLCSFAQTPKPAAPEKTLAIHAANLIDGVAAQPRHNVLVIIKGNKIQSVT